MEFKYRCGQNSENSEDSEKYNVFETLEECTEACIEPDETIRENQL